MKMKASILGPGPRAEVSLRTGGHGTGAILAEDGWQGATHTQKNMHPQPPSHFAPFCCYVTGTAS